MNAKDPLVDGGQGLRLRLARPASTCRARRSGRIADRHWKLAYWKSMKRLLLQDRRRGLGQAATSCTLFAHEFCLEGNHYRAGDAVNFSIGQGDTIVTPLQLARAYAALSNGGTLYEPRVAKAIVSAGRHRAAQIPPKVAGHVPAHRRRAALRRHRRCSAPRRSAPWPGSSPTSRSTRCTSAARPARPRSTASSRPRGSRPTTRTTWS